MEKSKYAGIGASIVAGIKKTRKPFGVDFGVGDVIVLKEEKRRIPSQLDNKFDFNGKMLPKVFRKTF